MRTGMQADLMYDAIIIGGGPAGLSAALVLGRSCNRVLLIDAGQPRNAAARQLNGFLGHDGISPADLLSLGRQHLARYGVEILAGVVKSAERIDCSPPHPFPTAFSIETDDGRVICGRKLLFATGIIDELPDYPGIRECYGATIHHCPYCDGWEHRGEKILVLGKEISKAVGLAIALKGWSQDVTLLANGQPLGAEQFDRLSKHAIACAEPRIVRFVHQGDKLEGVELAGNVMLPAEALFLVPDHRPGSDLPRRLGVDFETDLIGKTNCKQKTDVPGLFLAGDADGDVQFAIVAAAEGATAALAINRELQDEGKCAPADGAPHSAGVARR